MKQKSKLPFMQKKKDHVYVQFLRFRIYIVKVTELPGPDSGSWRVELVPLIDSLELSEVGEPRLNELDNLKFKSLSRVSHTGCPPHNFE